MAEMSSSFNFWTVWLQGPKEKKEASMNKTFLNKKTISVWAGSPTVRDEESRVVEMRKSPPVVAFPSSSSCFLLIAFLADDEGGEGSIHWVTGHLADDSMSYLLDAVVCFFQRVTSGNAEPF